ncbi:MAG: sulfite exporter TauE/SafE family protein [Propionibacteriaceae bacterium]|nr:sulfite exporter TauE/SafE family protein [Propionibacteriaceae bacterium]
MVAGIAAGLLGIGGGVIVVPVMMIVFGVSDLVAKGVSLVMMAPAVISALIGNLFGHRVLVRAGLIIGLSAVVTGPFGAQIAHLLPPRIANILFACYLVFVVIMMIRKVIAPGPTPPSNAEMETP